jgi:hypothetical protein
MKIGADLMRPKHRNRFGKKRIDATHPRRGRTRDAAIEMHHLLARMHPAVGAPGADRGDGLAGDPFERRFEHVLNGAAARLGLPAEQAAAVIFDS